jgi:hydrogenase maturation protease
VTEEKAQDDAEKPIDLLVLGLGNVILGDDGLGAAAVARLESRYRIPEGVRLEDGGTLGLALLDLIGEARNLILVDAVRTGEPPGTLVRLDGGDVMDAVRDRLSAHQAGVADLLDAARLIDCYPATVTLLGLTPETIDLSVVRSGPVDEGLDGLVAAVVSEVQAFGYQMVPAPEATGRHRPINNLARHFGM